ncbi:MAG: hypothetical protein ACOCR1_01230, partial [Planctomycetota bacterium]
VYCSGAVEFLDDRCQSGRREGTAALRSVRLLLEEAHGQDNELPAVWGTRILFRPGVPTVRDVYPG